MNLEHTRLAGAAATVTSDSKFFQSCILSIVSTYLDDKTGDFLIL
jgi:hypothetical protein